MQSMRDEANKRTLCSLETVFSNGRKTFKGRIETMSNIGAIVLTDEPLQMEEGENIQLTVVCDGREDVIEAEVIWSEKSAFGAKFV